MSASLGQGVPGQLANTSEHAWEGVLGKISLAIGRLRKQTTVSSAGGRHPSGETQRRQKAERQVFSLCVSGDILLLLFLDNNAPGLGAFGLEPELTPLAPYFSGLLVWIGTTPPAFLGLVISAAQ